MGTQRGSSRERRLRCFISAPHELTLETLRGALRLRNVDVVGADDLLPGQPMADALRKAIASSDFVLVVVPRGGAPPSVWVEAGYALGIGKPLAAIVSPDAQVPWDRVSALTIQTEPGDLDAINFHLGEFLKDVRSRPRSRGPREARKPQETDLTDLISEFDSMMRRGQVDHRALERLVLTALTRLPEARVKHQNRTGPDIVAWFGKLGPGINPVLIEIKSQARGKADLRRIADRLGEDVERAGGGTGLLLLGRISERDLPFSVTAGTVRRDVVILSIHAFLKGTQAGHLGRMLSMFSHGAQGSLGTLLA